MARRSKCPEKVDYSPEAMEKQAQRRLAKQRDLEAKQRELRKERAAVVHSYALRSGSTGLIEVEGVGEEGAGVKLKESFEVVFDKRLLLLSADGTVQGKARGNDFAEIKLGEITAHRDAFGVEGILGFEGVDFSGQSGDGTPAVAQYIAETLLATQNGARGGLVVVAFGAGSIQDMPSSPRYDRGLERGEFINKLGIVLGLDMHGEPSPVFDHAIYADPMASLYGPPEEIHADESDTGPGMDLLG